MAKADSSPTVGKRVTSTPTVTGTASAATAGKATESNAEVIEGGIGDQPIGGMYVIADTMTLPDGTVVELHYPPNE